MMMPIGTGGGVVGGVAPTVPVDPTATVVQYLEQQYSEQDLP